MSETAVTSFVLRFTQESEAPPTAWRGLIRHIQTDQEIHFVRIEDALQFIAQFIELGNWQVTIDN